MDKTRESDKELEKNIIRLVKKIHNRELLEYFYLFLKIKAGL